MAKQSKYASYDEVPVFRKQWFFWTIFFVLPNAFSFGGLACDIALLKVIGLLIQIGAVVLLLQGDVYYLKKNEVKSFGIANRIVAGIIVGVFLLKTIAMLFGK